jgi:hypothetical protein
MFISEIPEIALLHSRFWEALTYVRFCKVKPRASNFLRVFSLVTAVGELIFTINLERDFKKLKLG